MFLPAGCLSCHPFNSAKTRNRKALQVQIVLWIFAETNSFVKLLFEVLSSGEYDSDLKAKRAAAKSAQPVAKEPSSVIPVTRVSESTSGSSVSSHGDVDLRMSRPGAVVQPLIAGNGGLVDKDDRRADEFRPGPDGSHRMEPLNRRDWKRRSPQRMVWWQCCSCDTCFFLLTAHVCFSVYADLVWSGATVIFHFCLFHTCRLSQTKTVFFTTPLYA